MNEVKVRFVEGPWDGRVELVDPYHYGHPSLVVPWPVKLSAQEMWQPADEPVSLSNHTFAYGFVEIPEFGWFGLPGTMPFPQQVFSRNVVSKGHPDHIEWQTELTRRHLTRWIQGEGRKEIPETRGVEIEDDGSRQQAIITVKAWTYK